MDYTIEKATMNDSATIDVLFEQAILFQKANNYIGWNSYDRAYTKKEIQKGLLFKIISKDAIVCVFSICYEDALIWREKENNDAIYLHRIVLDRNFQGERTFQKILDWTITLAKEKRRKYIRMDTWAGNEKLIGYYESYGFRFVENYTTPGTKKLPVQHRNLKVALLEFIVNKYSESGYRFLDNLERHWSYSLKKVNINHELSTINSFWRQKVIGQANGQLIKLVKGLGEIIWHKHDDQDELFLLIKSHLTIQLLDQNIELYQNDIFIVPKGIEHCPKAHDEVELLIMGLNITSDLTDGRPDHWPRESISLQKDSKHQI